MNTDPATGVLRDRAPFPTHSDFRTRTRNATVDPPPAPLRGSPPVLFFRPHESRSTFREQVLKPFQRLAQPREKDDDDPR